jgi:hypothetical protein
MLVVNLNGELLKGRTGNHLPFLKMPILKVIHLISGG